LMAFFTLLAAHALDTTSLQPYRADYTLSIGDQVMGKAFRQLHVLGKGQYSFETDADAGVMAHAHESSEFSINDQGRLVASHYHLQRKLLFSHRQTDLIFNWSQNQLQTQTERDGVQNFSLLPGTLDKLSLEIQMRLDLQKPNPELSYPLADADGIKTYRYMVTGKETLDTALGKLDTLKVERPQDPSSARSTIFWVAPSLDYLPVQVEQIEHGTVFLLRITHYDPSRS
ncbi:MAG: DUF3108 domain-containing protein, partial [Pseudomonadales bacterium]|nr:DUF3108 domain-containing protein [Pseudomonadales bacterium]